MRIVTVGNMEEFSTYLKDIFSSSYQMICLDNTEKALNFSFKKGDFVFANIEDEDTRFKLEEYLNNRYRLICFYHKNEFYPFQTFYQTMFIPITSSESTLREAIVRLGEEKETEDKDITLIGSSRCMEDVRSQIDKYSKMPYSIHLSGNTGTGKNVAARRIHRLSGLKSKMVYVNCGACYNPNLMESNLFGFTKGAYTGATTNRGGYLKNAHKSFLFLDEIENMPHYMQEMLLDVIESGKYKTIGSDVDSDSDFRLITASNVPLETLMDEGRLRKDFFYRIGQRKIHMPSLIEHMDDIPELVQYYEKQNNIIRNRIKDYTPLLKRQWDGNIRELYNELSIMHEENALLENQKNNHRF